MTTAAAIPVKIMPCRVPAFGDGYKRQRLDGQDGFLNWYATATGAASEARDRGYDLQFENVAEAALVENFWIPEMVEQARKHGKDVVMCGNRDDGWCAVIIGGDGEYDLQCSPLFMSELGETRADALYAFKRNYGFEISPSRHVANCRI